jgi:hypothetical protein
MENSGARDVPVDAALNPSRGFSTDQRETTWAPLSTDLDLPRCLLRSRRLPRLLVYYQHPCANKPIVFTSPRVSSVDYRSGSGCRGRSDWRFCHACRWTPPFALRSLSTSEDRRLIPIGLIDHPYPFGAELASPTSGRWLTNGTSPRGTSFHLFLLFALSQNIPGTSFGGTE